MAFKLTILFMMVFLASGVFGDTKFDYTPKPEEEINLQEECKAKIKDDKFHYLSERMCIICGEYFKDDTFYDACRSECFHNGHMAKCVGLMGKIKL